MIIPKREMIMQPILPAKGLIMLYAKRGVGKTYVALTMAITIAYGKSMFDNKWKCSKPHTVLLIDGEMPASVLQERLKLIVSKSFAYK